MRAYPRLLDLLSQVFNQFPAMLLTLTCAGKILDGHLTPSYGDVFGDFPAYQYLNTQLDGYDNDKKTVPSLSITANARWKPHYRIRLIECLGIGRPGSSLKTSPWLGVR